jgi:hypothetical protein
MNREHSGCGKSRHLDSSYMAVVLHMTGSVEGFHIIPHTLLSGFSFTINWLDIHYPQAIFGTLVA